MSFDYTNPSFDLFASVPVRPPTPHRPDPRDQPLEPLKAVRDGFTRTPAEGEELICPSCEEELCTGPKEGKRTVWAVKSCGHVYCGECVGRVGESGSVADGWHNRGARGGAARGRGGTRKGKERQGKGAVVSKCVVDGCGVSMRGMKSVFQVYL